MADKCLVCNTFIDEEDRVTINSERLLVLCEIIGKTLDENSLHSKVICNSCQNSCTEYEDLKISMQQIRTEVTDKFKTTLSRLDMDIDTYPMKTPPKEMKRVVVPASKLQPLPTNMIVGNMARLNSLSPQKNLPKLVIPSSSLSPIKIRPIVSSNSKIQINRKSDSTEKIINNTLADILNPKPAEPNVMRFKPMTKDLNSAVLTKVVDKSNVKEEIDDEINNEEQVMEIDQDCTLIHVSADSNDTTEENKDAGSSKQYYDVSLIGDGSNGDNIIGNLQILDREGDEDNDDTHTIVMSGDNGSILRIMSGQKLVYENGEITLASDDENSNHGQIDGHDSNEEESQIELQVSGDEETANAIIAAAQEQGGAFIKVESGEMYRVKSVHSTSGTDIVQMVEREDGGFKCLLCNNKQNQESSTYTLYDAELMMQHLKDAHNARIYICQVCNKVIRKRADFYAHTSEEHGTKLGKVVIDNERGKLHECTECKKKYNSRTLLEEHMNMHSGSRPYACALCSKTFASKYTHQAHLKTHMERPRPYKCHQCPKSFFSQQNLSQHEKTHLGIKDFICKICGKAFGTQHNLEVHGVVHSGARPFPCGHCGKTFARRPELRDHIRIHTGERPFACDICGATFKQRSNLHSHRRATHLDDRRYECGHTGCHKKFKRRRLLEYHIKASHTGERPLQCDVCHATFVYPEHYKKHARIHSGEKPFVCEVCGKSFNSRDNRNTHRFVHSDKKPYECLVCGAGYMRKQLLYAHMNTSGHLAESIVVNQPRVHKVRQQKNNSESSQKNIQTLMVNNDCAVSCEEVVQENDGTPKLILTEDKKLIIQDGKSTINLVQDTDDPTLLTIIQNLESGKLSDGSVEGLTAEHLGEQVQMVTSDENGEIRLVQVHINANPTAWLLNQQ